MGHDIEPLTYDGPSFCSCRINMRNTALQDEAYRVIWTKGMNGWSVMEVRVRRDSKRGQHWATLSGAHQERRILTLLQQAGAWPT
jgi:hypothetical protein